MDFLILALDFRFILGLIDIRNLGHLIQSFISVIFDMKI